MARNSHTTSTLSAIVAARQQQWTLFSALAKRDILSSPPPPSFHRHYLHILPPPLSLARRKSREAQPNHEESHPLLRNMCAQIIQMQLQLQSQDHLLRQLANQERYFCSPNSGIREEGEIDDSRHSKAVSKTAESEVGKHSSAPSAEREPEITENHEEKPTCLPTITWLVGKCENATKKAGASVTVDKKIFRDEGKKMTLGSPAKPGRNLSRSMESKEGRMNKKRLQIKEHLPNERKTMTTKDVANSLLHYSVQLREYEHELMLRWLSPKSITTIPCDLETQKLDVKSRKSSMINEMDEYHENIELVPTSTKLEKRNNERFIDVIMDEVLEDVVEELSNLCNDYVDHLYLCEFLEVSHAQEK